MMLIEGILHIIALGWFTVIMPMYFVIKFFKNKKNGYGD
jgi:hypothetical protein